MNPILVVNNLVKTFPGKPAFTAVDHISFHLNEGEVLGFLGPNGAGKTTTIQMLLGLLTPTAGTIRFFGKDLVSNRSEILKHVSFASTYLRLPPNLTVYENLEVYGRLYGLDARARAHGIKKYLHQFAMWNYKDRKVVSLSAGQMTRVMLAKAFLPEPRIVLLDEPTASLDPDVCEEIRAFILKQQEQQRTSIIFTSHNMAEVEEVCDSVVVIKNGRIIASDIPSVLARSVSDARVRLFGVDRTAFESFAEQKKVQFQFLPHEVEITIHEEEIAWLFNSMAQHGLMFSQVSIDKPSLEDYFLHIAK